MRQRGSLLQNCRLYTLLSLAAIALGFSGLSGFASIPQQARGAAAAKAQTGHNSTTISCTQGVPHAAQNSSGQPQESELSITIIDENNVPVSSAVLTLTQLKTQATFKGETNYAGHYQFTGLDPGDYSLHAQKEGFYVVSLKSVRVGQTKSVVLTLNHQREYVEVVNVTSSPPAIDPGRTAQTEKLNNREIVNLPYTVTRDIRYALPLMPGVLQDGIGQIHLDGSATSQIFDQLDGFDVTDPVNGRFTMRVSVDAIRSVKVECSRLSAEHGKGSGGLLDLRTGMGDNRFRFSGTDFIPSLGSTKGIHLNTWTPRLTFSGPLRKGKAWFLEALEGEYDLTVVKELPAGADRNPVWRFSDLSKAQINWSESSRLTTSFLVNRFRSEHAGLSLFNPLPTTTDQGRTAYLFTIYNQSYLSNGILLDAGMGVSHFDDSFRPLGTLPYVIRPEGTSGNFFKKAHNRATRLQWIGDLTAPPFEWHGHHQFKIGTDLDRITYHQFTERRMFSILREDGTLSREVLFEGNPNFQRNNFDISGYVQDRWSVSDRLLIESGLRLDHDEVVRHVLVGPRLASTYMLTRDGKTKLDMGIGLYYDSSNLVLVTEPLMGRRVDLFFDPTGQNLTMPPLITSFHVDEAQLEGPRFLNWSLGLERKLPGSNYLRVSFLQKRGSDGWDYSLPSNSPQTSGYFQLRTTKRDHYDAFRVTLRSTFKHNYPLLASYTHSSARSSAVLNFNIDNPIFSRQAAGPLPWDSPNRFLAWGWLPFPDRFRFEYSLDWHDGFPFSLVNQNQQLVGTPGMKRFPDYFSLNVRVERIFRILGFQWDLGAGFDDLTNRANPTVVNNNVDSPQFLTFAGIAGRAFTGRIRLLGRK